MSSDLNFNVQGNSQAQINQTGDANNATEVKAKAQVNAQVKDTLVPSDPTGILKNLESYVANTTRPLLPKPISVTLGAQSVQKDSKGEESAASQSAASGGAPVQSDQQVTDTKIPEQKQQREGQGQGQGDQQENGKQGKAPAQPQSLQTSIKQLSQLIEKGQIPSYSPDEISNFLNQIGAAKTQNAKTPNVTQNNQTQGTGASASTESADEPLLDLKVEGNKITGPNGTVTIPKPSTPPKTPADMLTNVYWQMKDIASIAKQMTEAMPASPEKVVLMDYLRKITVALQKFEQGLYTIDSQTSTQIRERSQAQLETSLKKLQDQWDKQKEMEEKQKDADNKSNSMGILGKVFGAISIIMSIVLVAIFIWTGPLALLAVGFMVATIASTVTQMATNKSLFQRVFEALDSLMGLIMDSAGITGSAQDALKLITKIMVVLVVCVLVIASSPLMFLFGGVGNVIQFLTDSNVIAEFVGDCGGDKKAQMIATIVATALIMLVTMILNIAIMFIPGAQLGIIAEVGTAVANVAKTIVNALVQALMWALRITKEVAEKVVKVLQAVMKIVLNPAMWVSATQVGLETASATVNYQMHSLLADIAKMQGALEQEMEQYDAVIASLKKIIDTLLQSLQDMVQFIGQTSGLINKNFDNMSESMTALWSAS